MFDLYSVLLGAAFAVPLILVLAVILWKFVVLLNIPRGEAPGGTPPVNPLPGEAQGPWRQEIRDTIAELRRICVGIQAAAGMPQHVEVLAASLYRLRTIAELVARHSPFTLRLPDVEKQDAAIIALDFSSSTTVIAQELGAAAISLQKELEQHRITRVMLGFAGSLFQIVEELKPEMFRLKELGGLIESGTCLYRAIVEAALAAVALRLQGAASVTVVVFTDGQNGRPPFDIDSARIAFHLLRGLGIPCRICGFSDPLQPLSVAFLQGFLARLEQEGASLNPMAVSNAGEALRLGSAFISEHVTQERRARETRMGPDMDIAPPDLEL